MRVFGESPADGTRWPSSRRIGYVAEDQVLPPGSTYLPILIALHLLPVPTLGWRSMERELWTVSGWTHGRILSI